MKNYVPVLTLIAFIGGLGSAYAGGGGYDAGRMRNPDGRGLNMSYRQYNEAVKRRGKRTAPPGQMQMQH
jgi:hypothetical protein